VLGLAEQVHRDDDTYRGFELAAKVKSGAVHVNMPTMDDEIQAPIGGVRDSGWGRTGPYSIDFTDLIWLNVRSGQRHLPIAGPARNGSRRSSTAG
jgi:acyl-CoA reductase-like NAD-dependent aldehyde dehydrogenase